MRRGDESLERLIVVGNTEGHVADLQHDVLTSSRTQNRIRISAMWLGPLNHGEISFVLERRPPPTIIRDDEHDQKERKGVAYVV
ncbi:unnamed protein product, partial [Iphiclides podalirius]